MNYYCELENVEIKHYTQLLSELIEAGKIKLSKQLTMRATYHDPCYLGRRQKVYDEPRKILKAIPGLEFVEIKQWTRERSFCCGGGGAGLFYDLPEIDFDLIRADQIKETEVNVVAVACPICHQMIEDAIKSRGYEIEVKDIAELVRAAL